MKKEKLKECIHDVIFTAAAGIAAAIIIGIILFVIFYFVGGIESGIQAARSGLFLTGAMLMLISAGLLLTGKGNDVREYGWWINHYRRFSLFGAMLVFALSVILAAGIYDYILFYV